MPTALKLQEEFKDSLQTVFVEVGRANDAQMSAFAIDRGWYGGDGSDSAIWTKERPFDVGTGSIPAFALMDESGKVILSGTTSRMHKQIEEAIEEHDKARSKGPDDLPKSVAKLHVDMAKGKFGASLAAARKLSIDGTARDPEVQPAAALAVEAFESRLSADLKRIDWRIGRGDYDTAESDLKSLQKALKGCDDWIEKVDERLTALESDDLAEERKAAKALSKLEKKLYSKGTDKVKASTLRSLAEKHPGTRAAARAEELAVIVEAG